MQPFVITGNDGMGRYFVILVDDPEKSIRERRRIRAMAKIVEAPSELQAIVGTEVNMSLDDNTVTLELDVQIVLHHLGFILHRHHT